jgi:phosphoglycerol transferase MdoB-like AlkP superfamily enzyme
MTKKQLQIMSYAIAIATFVVVFEILDVLAGYNAGVAIQWLVIIVSLLIASAVLLVVALCVMAVSPPKRHRRY